MSLLSDLAQVGIMETKVLSAPEALAPDPPFLDASRLGMDQAFSRTFMPLFLAIMNC
jgi:hypothetical protein